MTNLTLLPKDAEHEPLGGKGQTSNSNQDNKLVDTIVGLSTKKGNLPKQSFGNLPVGAKVVTKYGQGEIIKVNRNPCQGVTFEVRLLVTNQAKTCSHEDVEIYKAP